jgi:hypothetical protein
MGVIHRRKSKYFGGFSEKRIKLFILKIIKDLQDKAYSTVIDADLAALVQIDYKETKRLLVEMEKEGLIESFIDIHTEEELEEYSGEDEDDTRYEVIKK